MTIVLQEFIKMLMKLGSMYHPFVEIVDSFKSNYISKTREWFVKKYEELSILPSL
jgi:hypothetical protein